MEILLDVLSRYVADPHLLRLLIVGLAATTVVVFGLGIGYLFVSAADPIRRRLGEMSTDDVDDGGLKVRKLVKFETIMGPMASFVLPKEEIERSRVTQKLVYAGYRGPNALQTFYAVKAVLCVGLPLMTYAVAGWFPRLSTDSLMIYALVAAGVGLLAPNMVLDRLVDSRIRKLRNAFPDALDLMVVCVEAGLGLTQSIQRVSDELFVNHPELAMELALVNAEMRAGVDSVSALKNLADRTGLEDIRGLVSLLVQTLRFGTGIADSLRVYSEEFRDKRMQKAEEVAAKMGTKLIFPLIVFMFPGFFVVVVGPAAIALIDVFRVLEH
jgi:tight adherence protein C